MKEIERFKGDRKYVHATDELLTAEPLFNGAESFTFTARKVGTCASRWFNVDDKPSDNWEAIARLVVEGNGGEQRVYECRQDITRPIKMTVDFNENTIIQQSLDEGNELKFTLTQSFSLWEYLSTLQKTLLQRLIEHPHWYFVRLKLNASGYMHSQGDSVDMVLRFSRQKGPLFISDIMVNDVVVGEIAFSKR